MRWEKSRGGTNSWVEWHKMRFEENLKLKARGVCEEKIEVERLD